MNTLTAWSDFLSANGITFETATYGDEIVFHLESGSAFFASYAEVDVVFNSEGTFTGVHAHDL